MTIDADHALALHEGLAASDFIIAKLVKPSEVAQIARLETMLRIFLWLQWTKSSDRAIKVAGAAARAGKKADAIASAVDDAMSSFGIAVKSRIEHDVEDIYKLSRTAAWKKGTGRSKASLQYNMPPMVTQPTEKADPEVAAELTFDLVDRQAIKALQKSQTFWVGDFYPRSLSPVMRRTIAETMIDEGQDRTAAGEALEAAVLERFTTIEIPSGWAGMARDYWESSAANIATAARAHGSMRSFDQLGFTTYEVVNPDDERTCPVCKHLDGKIFSVAEGMKQIGRELAAKTPEAIKEIHPWLNRAAMYALSPTAGKAGGPKQSAALSNSGFAMPPFHFRCRCAIDVVAEGFTRPEEFDPGDAPGAGGD